MLTLIAKKRDSVGKKVNSLRDAGLLPVVVYGPGEPTSNYSVILNDFIKVWKKAGETAVVSLEIEGAGSKNVLIQDVAVHAISGKPIHADFYAVKKGMKVSVNVPLRFEGDAPAVKAFNGILVKVMHDVKVEAEPDKLPQEIVVDVSVLGTLSDRITVKDLKLGDGVEAVTGADEVVALVSAIVEKEEKTEEPLDLTKIEVEKKGKKPVEGEEGAESDKK